MFVKYSNVGNHTVATIDKCPDKIIKNHHHNKQTPAFS